MVVGGRIVKSREERKLATEVIVCPGFIKVDRVIENGIKPSEKGYC
jgi:hypothetical protein